MFDDVRFPEDISYGADGGPSFSTTISISKNGAEQRNINWQNAMAKYKISNKLLSEEQMYNLISFFRARMGMAIGFRFKDWSDFNSKMEFTVNSNNVSSFQLTKTYTSGVRSYVREITKPIKETINILQDDTSIQNFILQDTGIITLNQPLKMGSKIKASFDFDVPVRFDSDILSIHPYKRNSWSHAPILITEIRIV